MLTENMRVLHIFQIGLYEEKMKKLHEDMVNIQVENSTLQSQSSSLLSQINQLQITQGTLETSKRKVRLFNCMARRGCLQSSSPWFQAEEEEKRYKAERTDLLRDQAGLQKLHDQLQTDYDALLTEREAQKDVERMLKADLRKLQVGQWCNNPRLLNFFLRRDKKTSLCTWYM